MLFRRHFATCLLAAALSAPLPAQTPNPLVGTWSVEYEVGRRMEDGQATSIMGKGTFTIVSSGDSLLVTIQAPPRPDGSVVPPSTVGARISNGTAVINQKQTARMNINGEVTVHEVTITWNLQASGDTLSGTMAREIPMMSEPLAPSPVKGTRVKS